MPTYQYVCGSCEEPLEVVQSFTDDALTVCPACGESSLRKVFGSVGVVFKGSGFYRNDSRSSTSTTTPATSKSDGSSAASTSTPSTSTSTSSPSTPSTSA